MPVAAVAIGLLAGLIAVIAYFVFSGDDEDAGTPDTTPPTAASVVRVRLVSRAERVGLILNGFPQTVEAQEVPEARVYAGTPSSPVGVNGKRYRGTIRLVPVGSGVFDVVNEVSIDDYLEGVVPREAYASWPLEALKVQAVASRTYALFQVRSRIDADRHFDLRADTGSQMYGGIEGETVATSRAVRETRGLVLVDGPAGAERIFCAYFSSTCGGIAASGADIFNDPTPALAAHESDGCVDSPRYRWPEFSIRKDELARRLRLWGTRQSSPVAGIGRIRAVEVARVNEFGRPVRFAVTDEANMRYELGGEHFRNACNAGRPEGQPEFLSSFFTPVDAGDSVRITDGRGWGHGVGMCQYCTAGWARRGIGFERMLVMAYPGAKIVRAY